jgi:regulator of sigma D
MTTTAIDYSRKQAQGSTFQHFTAQHTTVQQIVESLLQSRTETLSLYKDIMSFRPFEQNDILQEVLEDFCETMVDYTARAHFKLYNFLDINKENQAPLKLSMNVYPSLMDNTQHILDFHDKYNSDISEFDCEKLDACLNQVGELLADRILLEDHIIDAMLSSRS